MPTVARQNMLLLAVSVKVHYKKNTIVFLIELKYSRLLILRNKELFWFLLLILYPNKKSKGHQTVFFLSFTRFLDLKNKLKDSAKIIWDNVYRAQKQTYSIFLE